ACQLCQGSERESSRRGADLLQKVNRAEAPQDSRPREDRGPPALQGLDDHGDSLAATDAGGADTEFFTAPPKLVEQMPGDARARGPEWVAQSDGAAVDVGALARQSQRLLHGQVVRREGLVHLEEG